MMDYTWVVDQVKNTSIDRELYEKVMIEYCTDEDSELGQVAEERPDARNIRITRKDADLSKKSGLDYALKIADDNPGADLWGALPCTAISALQNGYVGRAGSQHWAKLDGKRKNLKKLVDNYILLGRRVKANGGDIHFEWPRNCHGWKLFPQLMMFFGEMGMEKANFDGCQVGSTNRSGAPIYKPWTVWTSRKKLATVLRGKRCPDPEGHGHAECCGKDATESGRYPKQLARLIWRWGCASPACAPPG